MCHSVNNSRPMVGLAWTSLGQTKPSLIFWRPSAVSMVRRASLKWALISARFRLLLQTPWQSVGLCQTTSVVFILSLAATACSGLGLVVVGRVAVFGVGTEVHSPKTRLPGFAPRPMCSFGQSSHPATILFFVCHKKYGGPRCSAATVLQPIAFLMNRLVWWAITALCWVVRADHLKRSSAA